MASRAGFIKDMRLKRHQNKSERFFSQTKREVVSFSQNGCAGFSLRQDGCEFNRAALEAVMVIFVVMADLWRKVLRRRRMVVESWRSFRLRGCHQFLFRALFRQMIILL